MNSRRNFLRAALAVGAGAAASAKALAQEHQHTQQKASQSAEQGSRTSHRAAGVSLAVETPDVPQLAPQIENGVKVFHLIAEPVKREIYPGKVVDLWGYNGSVPGPTIQVTQGDRVRIVVENRLPEPTSMHWHGFEIPVEMDGMPGISQPLILPGEKFVYEFTLHQAGTFFYHSHMSMQEMMGMIGMFIMHPKDAWRPRVDRDFGFVLQEFAVLPNSSVPNSLSLAAAYPQVLIAQRTLFQLQGDYIEAMEAMWTNSIALQGYLLTDGLEAPARAGEMDQPVREINVPMARPMEK